MNRVLQAFKGWEERKKEFEAILKSGTADDGILNRLQLDHFRQSRHRLRADIRPDEMPFLLLLDNHIRKLEKQRYPNVVIRLLSRMINRFIAGPRQLKQETLQRAANLDTLTQLLRKAGLDVLGRKLDTHLTAGATRVSVPLDCHLSADRRLNFQLAFEKDGAQTFRLETITAELLQNGSRLNRQEFDTAEWPELNAGQMLSLLEGRALTQPFTDASGHYSQRWIQLGPDGLRRFDPVNGLNLDTALSAMSGIQRDRGELQGLLENGQLVMTHWKHNGQLKTIYLKADPASKTVLLLDEKQKPTTAEKLNRSLEQSACQVKVLQVKERKIRKGVQHVH